MSAGLRLVLLIRGANATVVWQYVRLPDHTGQWVCLRDNFTVKQATEPSGVEAQLLSIATHSIPLTGAITQVVQLAL